MLEGLKVVELATYIAAPGAGAMMADWGAEVVKIEPPAGDPMRGFFATLGSEQAVNPVFDFDNRGKRAVVLDISKPEGREAALRLVRTADVFLTNIRPGALKRAGMDWDSLRAENARLIYASVTGYGLQGADADKAGMDVASFWSRAGVGSLTAPKGTEPFPLRTGMGDHICSLATVSAILAAVVERARTGEGRLVETSLLRTGTYAIASDMAIQLKLGRVASTRPRRQAVLPLANFFQTSDGRWLTLVVRQGGKSDWPKIAAAAGKPELVDDPRFTTSRLRAQNVDALVTLLDEGFGAFTYEEAAERLTDADITWAPYQTPREVAEDPQAEAAGCFVQMPHAAGAYRAPAGPARFPGADDGPKGPAPLLGEHTAQVLAELGYSDAEVAAMKASGAAA